MTKKMREFREKLQTNNEMQIAELYERNFKLDAEEEKAALEFFKELAKLLNGKYEIVGSCNKDISQYLVPVGTAEEISYYGKPVKSFRISDHWNWFTSLKKCSDPNYIQCESVHMPHPRKRRAEGEATRPWKGVQVAIQGTDGKYHHVFGNKWDRKKKEFKWVENTPLEVCEWWGLI
jgi:hypothetical protein